MLVNSRLTLEQKQNRVSTLKGILKRIRDEAGNAIGKQEERFVLAIEEELKQLNLDKG